MNLVDIQSIPNQKFSVTLENSFYDIAIKEANGAMAIDIVRDGVAIVTGQRIVAGTMIIPYLYLETGNFFMINMADSLIYYPEFSVSQFLVYLSRQDLEVMRTA